MTVGAMMRRAVRKARLAAILALMTPGYSRLPEPTK
jgi:hypothetical protein